MAGPSRASVSPTPEHLIEADMKATKNTSTTCAAVAGVVCACAGIALVAGVVTWWQLTDVSGGGNEPPAWTEWGAWGDCDVICDGGFQARTRTCQPGSGSTECEGADTQQQKCGTDACLRPEFAAAKWSSWGGWGDCSQTCGSGTQVRQRECDNQYLNGTCDSGGEAQETRACPGWPCPDCALLECGGYAGANKSDNCTRCVCVDGTIIGRVLSTSNIPLEGVSISGPSSPYEVVATSTDTGYFSLPDVCPGQPMLFSRHGYFNATFEAEVEGGWTVRMTKIEPLEISEEPGSVYRLVGEAATLCCTAKGSPEPRYYEWFYYDRLIHRSDTSGQASLALENLQTTDTGLYKCRANNDFGAVFSREVEVKVRESAAGFCPSSPLPRVISLPAGCTRLGQTTYDVGECPADPCTQAGGTGGGGCGEAGPTYCCGPTGYSQVALECEDGEDQMVLAVTTCGCVECGDETLEIIGLVVSSNTSEPLPDIRLTANSTQMAITDAAGEFSFPAPALERFTLSLVDPTNQYVATTRVVTITEGTEGVFFVRLEMWPVAPVKVSFDSTASAEITLGDDEEEFADILLPADSFYTATGEKYTGRVEARINVMDPTKEEDVLNAPGDLSFVDEEGEVSPLQTFGMFNLQLEDDNGNPISSDGEMEIGIDTASTEIGSDGKPITKLWAMNPETGRWEIGGDFFEEDPTSFRKRRKRQIPSHRFTNALVANVSITVTRTWYNFDCDIHRLCYSKIRLYTDDRFGSQLSDADVKVIVLDKSSQSASSQYGQVSKVRPYNDNRNNGYCIAHLCRIDEDDASSNYEGYISVTHRSSPVFVSDSGIRDSGVKQRIGYKDVGDTAAYAKFDFVNQQSSNGPFYMSDGTYKYEYTYYHWWTDMRYTRTSWRGNWKDARTCSNAPEADHHFRFYKEKAAVCDESYTLLEEGKGVVPQNYLAWYTKRHVNSVQHQTACFIKVLTDAMTVLDIKATSHVGQDLPHNIKAGTVYGSRQKCTRDSSAVCLEVKPSGTVGDGKVESSDETLIKIKLVGDTAASCRSLEVNDRLREAGYIITTPADDLQFTMRLLYNNVDFTSHYDHAMGIYCTSHGNKDKAIIEARNACHKGVEPGKGKQQDEPMTVNNWALKYHCQDPTPATTSTASTPSTVTGSVDESANSTASDLNNSTGAINSTTVSSSNTVFPDAGTADPPSNIVTTVKAGVEQTTEFVTQDGRSTVEPGVEQTTYSFTAPNSNTELPEEATTDDYPTTIWWKK